MQPVYALGQHAVIRPSDRSDRRCDAGGGEALAVRQREVLAAVIVVGDQGGEVSPVLPLADPDRALDSVERTNSAVMVVAARQPRMPRA